MTLVCHPILDTTPTSPHLQAMSYAAPLPPRIHLICPTCGRRGAYSRERYIELTGTDNGVNGLGIFAREIAKCPRALKLDPMIEERCGIIHDLEAEGRPYLPQGNNYPTDP